MKIVFFGSAPFAVPALEAVKDHVCLVVTQPDQPTGRGMKLRQTAVADKADELGIPVEKPIKARDPEFVGQIEALQADVMVVAAYGQILSERLLNATKRGGINLHGSILPKYRGAAPIQRSIESGDEITGVTLMQMAKGMDTGDIIDIATTPIGPEETAGELTPRLAAIGAELLTKWIERICTGDYPRQEQNHDQATHAAKIDRTETILSFEMTAEEAHRKFRAFTPAPGTLLPTRLGRLKLGRVTICPDLNPGPGVISSVKPELVVGFADGSLSLVEVQPEGKNRVSGTDFANGARIKPGDCLS